MAGVLNAGLETLSKNWKMLGKSSVSSGSSAQRALFRGAGMYGESSRAARTSIGLASRALSGAIVGAGVGAIWGAASDKESILGGAMRGAFVGGAARVALRGLNPKFGGRFKGVRGLTSMTQNRNIISNVRTAWTSMGNTNPALRNWMVGAGVFGAIRGLGARDDNPIGGSIGGAIGGAIQGGMLYGGYRGGKSIYNRMRK